MEAGTNYIITQYNNRNDNLGDQFIYLRLVESLKAYGKVLTASEPPDFATDVRKEGGKWRSRLDRSVCRLKGGKIYQFAPPGAKLSTVRSPVVQIQSSGLRAIAAQFLAGQSIQLGCSIIPESDFSALGELDWIGVRDQASLEALQRAGISQSHYFPDLSFLSPLYLPSKKKQFLVGLSFRRSFPELRSEESTVSGIKSVLEKDLASLAKSINAKPCFFHQVEEDASFAFDLCNEFQASLNDNRLNLCSYREFYSQCRVVISNRLHCLLVGASCGALPIALTTSSHTKLVSLFRTVGLEDLIVDYRDLSQSTKVFKNIGSKIDVLTQKVRSVFSDQKGIALQLLCDIMKN